MSLGWNLNPFIQTGMRVPITTIWRCLLWMKERSPWSSCRGKASSRDRVNRSSSCWKQGRPTIWFRADNIYDSLTSLPVICSGMSSRHCTLGRAFFNSFCKYSSSSVNFFCEIGTDFYCSILILNKLDSAKYNYAVNI